MLQSNATVAEHPMLAQVHRLAVAVPAGADPHSNRARILVVDDDECIRGLLKLHLRNAGYEVAAAEDAIAAGHALLQGIPDLMITDVCMPYMDGFEFVSAIRADRTLPFFPVIFLTSLEEAGERAGQLSAECLAKPVRADRLLAMVARLIRSKSVSRQAQCA
jgi:DNA-binding response OmpR family regulator